ncbi:glycosyltransferase family 2 protein [Thomasclavelia spiroformis]|uniref:glycosyltransferase family 2 protein n=1 Tax=Thomasclavelia spiroformis TaxID=29348 RepID=UPI0039995885
MCNDQLNESITIYQQNMKKISIIAPVYNVQNYIRRCIESLMHQTLKDIEIILGDDGFTDLSGIICDEYAKALA